MSKKILIVDDEPDMLRLLSMIIKGKTNYDTSVTNNPNEALELAKTGTFDVIITDLKMPVMDGLEFIRALRKFDANTPVVFITAYSTLEAADEALSYDAFDFISKPLKKEQLLFTIEKAMKWSTVMKENTELKKLLAEYKK